MMSGLRSIKQIHKIFKIKHNGNKININMEKSFVEHRKQIYSSINGTKGNLSKVRKSTLLSKGEKEKLDKVIEALEDLRVEYYNNRGSEK